MLLPIKQSPNTSDLPSYRPSPFFGEGDEDEEKTLLAPKI